MREYEFSQSQAEQVRVFYKYTFGLFALLLLVHMGFIGSAVPYVYSEQEASICGARKVISFLSHRVTLLGLIFVTAQPPLAHGHRRRISSPLDGRRIA